MVRNRLIALRSVPPWIVVALVACSADGPSRLARETADYAGATYSADMVATLGDLVAFQTVHEEGVDNATHPEFQAMTDYLAARAAELGLDFADHGEVVVVGLGESTERLGIITHGDVQPVDPSKWARDPFTLDSVSEPGRLLARGAEDDKGAIATALYAMTAVKDREIELDRRIELMISYTEESDWAPFQAFLAAHPPPALNVAIDAEYPVVVAEKSWNSVHISVPPLSRAPTAGPNRLIELGGGAFLSQIPEDARAVIAEATPELEAALKAAATRDADVRYRFLSDGEDLIVEARGLAAHSSKPEDGRNAITHLAALLGAWEWPDGQAPRMVRTINDLIGTGDYGERFGAVALEHPFMGPLTLSLTTLRRTGDRLAAGINIRSPAGRTPAELERLINEAIDAWTDETGIDVGTEVFVSAPYYPEDPPHVPALLEIFEHFTGIEDPRPIAIGGGTHARLVSNGVNFGPAMPGEPYTGHSEHEFITREQIELNLKMYTAMLVELAGR